MTTVRRTTTETDVSVTIDRATGTPTVSVATADAFFDHMVATFARYAGLDCAITATSDLDHHLREDVALTLGRAIHELTPARCARYGQATVPMDDALVTVVVDLGGRAYYGGALNDLDYDHVVRSIVTTAMATVHVVVSRGTDPHHETEAAMKALGLAVRAAMVDAGAVFSTKGTVTWEVH